MSVKAKIASAAATFALAGGGLGTAGTLSASAATRSCGSTCQDLYTQKFGTGDILDVKGGTAAAGQEVILFKASSSDPAEDFVITKLGSVGSSYGHHWGLITPQFDATFAALSAYEFQYEPSGVPSNLCLGTWPGELAQAGFKVRLEPCGRTRNVLWAFFGGQFAGDHITSGYDVLINGATDSISDPLVLNYPAGTPTDKPRPWLDVEPLHVYPDATVYNNQQWTYRNGPVK